MKYAGATQHPMPTTREVALEMKVMMTRKTRIAMTMALGLIPIFFSINSSYFISSRELRWRREAT